MIGVAIWLSGILVGVITAITIQGSLRRQALLRAQIDKLERQARALQAAPTEVTIQYTVRREGTDIVIAFEHGDRKPAEKYYLTDEAAATFVSAIVSKFTA